MAQTTGAISSTDFKIETSPDGSAWTDRSGFATKITPSGGERPTGQKHTFDGDTPIVTKGKRSARSYAVEYVYTEGASDLFEVVRAAHEAGSAFYLRWSPKGGQTGEFQFTTAAGVITTFTEPMGDAGSADPVVLSFELVTPSSTKSVAA